GHCVRGEWQFAHRGARHRAGLRAGGDSCRSWTGQPCGAPRCVVRREGASERFSARRLFCGRDGLTTRMKLRAYLVDDEPLALERLHRLLDATGRVEVTGSTTEPEKAVAALTADPPDVCFLDIQMPRLNGFEVLARLPIQPIVIFTTAYDQYALKAFDVNSVAYLLKPVEPESLERALQKVERLLGSAQFAQPNLHVLLEKITESLRETKPDYLDRIASRLGDRLWFLDLTRVT